MTPSECYHDLWKQETRVPMLSFSTVFVIHRVSKNVPPLACYNFDTHEWILTFFGRIVTNKVGNQKTRHYAISNILCFCTTWQNGKTQQSHFHSIGLCYINNAPVCCLPERKNCHLWFVWWRLTFVEIVRHPINAVHWLLLQAWRRTTPIFHTVTDTVTDFALIQSMWVIDSRMLCSLPRSCLVHPVDRFDSEGWFSSDQVIFQTLFRVFFCEKACSI